MRCSMNTSGYIYVEYNGGSGEVSLRLEVEILDTCDDGTYFVESTYDGTQFYIDQNEFSHGYW